VAKLKPKSRSRLLRPASKHQESGFDEFLDDITHGVHAKWQMCGGRELTIAELYQLNDTLEDFFTEKRPHG
jgi:hypothetical protein